MNLHHYLLLTLLFSPLVGSLLNFLVKKWTKESLIPGFIGSGSIFLSFIAAFSLLIYFLSHMGDVSITYHFFNWIQVGSFLVPFSLKIDPLSLLMVSMITFVGFLIHVYSVGYMEEDEGYSRYFIYLNLFMFSMLLLVLANNLLLMFVGWEGVGLCSYLLIGFWFEDEKNAAAGKKAFIVNRIGDFGFIIGLSLLFFQFGTFEFDSLQSLVSKFSINDPVILAATLLLFVGAIGKSAQIPLYVWLPDAMAGPTAVSALIHAATMVTAGVYMIARLHFLYILAPLTLEVVALIGGLTSLFAATIALTQSDIKKVLAYSTVSQLGLMFLAVGVGAFEAGIFHLFTHAFFKALLFLGAGSVIHACHHNQNILKMGGLKNKLKVTYLTFVVGTLAIAGIPPLSGFFSKDEILWNAYSSPLGSKVLWVIGLTTSLLTAFYMFRLLFLTFFGKYRGGHHPNFQDIHESPKTMTVPLIILSVGAAIVGFLGIPEIFHIGNFMEGFLGPVFHPSREILEHQFSQITFSHAEEIGLMVLTTCGVLISISIAYLLYGKESKLPQVIMQKLSFLHRVSFNKYFIDELYEKIIIRPTQYLSLFSSKIFDMLIIDGVVDAVGRGTLTVSRTLSRANVGDIKGYSLMILIGLFGFILFIFFLF